MSAAADCGGVEVGLTCFIDFGSACFGGFEGGLIHCGALCLIQKLHIDDPIGAFAVHGFVLPPSPQRWHSLQQQLLEEASSSLSRGVRLASSVSGGVAELVSFCGFCISGSCMTALIHTVVVDSANPRQHEL